MMQATDISHHAPDVYILAYMYVHVYTYKLIKGQRSNIKLEYL
jgi:hypothetical protein